MAFNSTWVPGPNRKIRHTPGGTEYVLYNTPVVTLSACGRMMKLQHGGHMTATTKATINQVFEHLGMGSRFKVYQDGGEWFLAEARSLDPIPFPEGKWVAL